MADDRIEKLIKEAGVETVIVTACDFYGHPRGKRLPVEEFYKIKDKGISFSSWYIVTNLADEIVPNTTLTSLEAGLPDICIKPDLDSFRLAPWHEKTAIVLCDFFRPDGTPLAACPRSILKRLEQKARDMGFLANFASELELYLFREDVQTLRDSRHTSLTPITPDIHCYSIYEAGLHEPYIAKIRSMLDGYIEACNPEWGPGQFEINLTHAGALEMADRSIIFKTCIKDLMAREGHSVTFMAKWNQDMSGSSGHMHQSLCDLNGDPVFYDEADPNKMSEVMKYYLGGNMAMVNDIMLLYAMNVNSYKRMVELSLGGTNLSWSIDNRTVAFRVINTSPGACRLENRIPGADVNPYLAIAGCLGSGLYGIENKIDPGEPVGGNAYEVDAERCPPLPKRLAQSIANLEASDKAAEIFGQDLITNLLELSHYEEEQFRTAVTDWEIHRYFETV